MLAVEQIHVGFVAQSLMQVTRQSRVGVVARAQAPTHSSGSPDPNLGDGDLVVGPGRHTGAGGIDLHHLDSMTPVSQGAGQCMRAPTAASAVGWVHVGHEPHVPGRHGLRTGPIQ